ncbi:MAG: glutathione S-transferase domain-containing protein [Pseudomonadales bacterium]|nr:glutathione S-transferase domain-containing protein [Pseudomonadales bacterium]
MTSFLKKHGIQLPERDTMLEADARSELLSGGGKAMVPCLRIEQSDGSFEWLYESLDILEYLKQLIRQP